MMDADGAHAKAFAPEAGNSNGASWNRDGTALLLNLISGGTQRSVRFGLTDGSQKTLWESNQPATRVHMTPDEQDLIYDTGRPRNIWKLHIKGEQARQLTFDRERAWFPEVSWDGKWIVYEVGRGDDTQIGVMDSNGGNQEILTKEPGKRFSHSFASDNRRIAYAGFESGVWNLYWIDRITASVNRSRTTLPTVRSCGVRHGVRGRNKWPTNTPRSKGISSCYRWVRGGSFTTTPPHQPADCWRTHKACAACGRLPTPACRLRR
jgi:Tol biopolymer transport system component